MPCVYCVVDKLSGDHVRIADKYIMLKQLTYLLFFGGLVLTRIF